MTNVVTSQFNHPVRLYIQFLVLLPASRQNEKLNLFTGFAMGGTHNGSA
jgi:hypothetical protein